MEIALIFSQTLFYLTVSATIIVLGVLFVMIGYYLMRITKELEGITRNIHEASEEVRERIADIIDKVRSIPFLSFLVRSMKDRDNQSKKSRTKKETL